jgi:hypothetical protein
MKTKELRPINPTPEGVGISAEYINDIIDRIEDLVQVAESQKPIAGEGIAIQYTATGCGHKHRMIYPRLNRVRNGQRLSVELVNGLIKRTEYAADLLRQYKLMQMYIEPHYDGTRVSYLQPLADNDFGYQSTCTQTIHLQRPIGQIYRRK